MIQGFAARETELFFRGGTCPARWRSFSSVAARKLDMIDAAVTLEDLSVPPGNRLEALKGDRSGQHSIRINDRWRICFIWTQRGPDHVEIVDFH